MALGSEVSGKFDMLVTCPSRDMTIAVRGACGIQRYRMVVVNGGRRLSLDLATALQQPDQYLNPVVILTSSLSENPPRMERLVLLVTFLDHRPDWSCLY